MANVLKVKHRYTGAAGAPSTLGRSELAFNEISSPTGGILYIGTAGESGGDATTKLAIGGPGAYTDLGSAQTLTNKDLTDTTNSFTAAGLTQAGVVELADVTETNAGTDAGKAVTPDGLDDWTGSARVTTLGTIATGVWSGTALVAAKVPRLNDITAPDGNLAMGSNEITGLADPTGDTSAATKSYVDAKAQGLDVKASVRLATAADLPACTYAQPVATTGVGATLTANANGALTIDSVAVALNDRILVRHQGTGIEVHAHNGIYKVTTLGAGGAAWVLTRATDFDENDEVTASAFVFVEEGTINADSGHVVNTDGAITFSSSTFSGVGWAQFSGAGQVTAGTGLTKSGNTLNAIGTANRISVGADAIDIDSAYVGQATITTLGTIGTGTWAATDVAVAHGGTGASSLTAGTVLLGNGTSAVTQLAKQAAGKILTSEGTAGGDGAVWSNSLSGITIDCGTF